MGGAAVPSGNAPAVGERIEQVRDIVVKNAQVGLYKVGLTSKGEWSLHVEVPLTLADSGPGLPGHLLAGWPGLVGLLQERDTDSTAESLKATEGALPGQYALTIWGSVEREGAPLLMASCSSCGPAEAVRVEGEVDTAFVRFALKVPWGNLTECMDMRSLASAMGGPCWLDLTPTEQPETRTSAKAPADDRQTSLLEHIDRAREAGAGFEAANVTIGGVVCDIEVGARFDWAKRQAFAEKLQRGVLAGELRARQVDTLLDVYAANDRARYLKDLEEAPREVLAAEYTLITGKAPSSTTEARLRLLIGNALAEGMI